MLLNKNQKMAVESSQHTLISACPGSGKTRVLSSRAVHLLETKPDTKVVAVTFTRDSADELRKRITEACGQTRRRLLTGTFHSIALKQIKNTSLFKGRRIVGGGEFYAFVKRAISVSQMTMEITQDDAVEAIESMKSTLRPNLGSDPASQVYRAYQSIMEREKVVDFADLLLLAVIGMENQSVKPIPATHLLVDEAQDMDDVQYAWIKKHGEAGSVITLVGDDDQSIYGWRHSLGYDGLLRFKTDHHADHITLDDNYRSDRTIINHANQLIGHGKQRVDKQSNCMTAHDGLVETVVHANEMEQATNIGKIVSDENEWAVLGRTKKVLDIVEIGLINANVPYIRVGGSGLWNIEVIAVYLSVLSAINKGSQNGVGCALDWAGVPDYCMESAKGATCLSEYLDGIISVLSKDDSLRMVTTFVKKFRLMLDQWEKLLVSKRDALVCAGVSIWLSDFVSKGQASLLERAADILTGLNGSLSERLNFVKQCGKKKKKAPNEAPAKVMLMTMHASKGLEFDCVMVASCVEGISPHVDSPIEEERRLFYVAMTRARHHLILSRYLQDSKNNTETERSRFLQEAFKS